MPRTKIKYANIRVEMARRDMTIKDMSNELQMPLRTLSTKLLGQCKFSLIEAYKIKQLFDKDIEYLFAEDIKGIKRV